MPIIEKSVWNALQKRLLSVSLRSQMKNNSRYWTIEMVFFGTPLQSTHHREQGTAINLRGFKIIEKPSP